MGKTYSEKEMVMARRQAYVTGRCVCGALWHPRMDVDAARLYPLPKKQVPRVVEFTQLNGAWVRVSYNPKSGFYDYCREGVGKFINFRDILRLLASDVDMGNIAKLVAELAALPDSPYDMVDDDDA